MNGPSNNGHKENMKTRTNFKNNNKTTKKKKNYFAAELFRGGMEKLFSALLLVISRADGFCLTEGMFDDLAWGSFSFLISFLFFI